MLEFLFILKALALGVVEGLTEFLPVSSTGHLILFGELLDFKGAFATSFEIMIQLGAVLAVVVLYRAKILGAFRNLGRGQWGRTMALNVIVGVLPPIVLAVALEDVIKAIFGSVAVVGAALILGAILLYLAEALTAGWKKKDEIDGITLKEALLVGFFQCLALVPGMSRSGSTISGGLFLGLTPRLAAEFSFFLSIPIMIGAFVFEISSLAVTSGVEAAALAVGFIVSFLVAYVVVRVFVDFLGKHSLRGFVWYRIALGLVLLGFVAAGIL